MPEFAFASERVVEWAYSCSSPWQKLQHKSQTCFPLELTESVSCSAVSLKAAGSYLACRHQHCHGYDVLVWEHHKPWLCSYFTLFLSQHADSRRCDHLHTADSEKNQLPDISLASFYLLCTRMCIASKRLVGEWACYHNNFLDKNLLTNVEQKRWRPFSSQLWIIMCACIATSSSLLHMAVCTITW